MPSVDSIFLAARQLPPDRRDAYLDKACGGDASIRRRVEEMLQRADEADAFFEETPVSDNSLLLRTPPGIRTAEDNLEQERIGKYRILERIGEGGMGVVYAAEQDEPISRRVAIKIIKLGMDTRQVVARFEAERQALAIMDHPNIAKVIDAGATETGRPYFVMELVRGIPITQFCDLNKLTLHQRLNLFLPVCRAIQSAHQKGVIHRDLKPSNVLVTELQGEAIPKVIDFGVAKATRFRLSEKTVFTQMGTIVGTPAYMSPEQAEMTGFDVDTRTDVYSLGVMLYELIAGSTPFPEERFRSLGLGDIQKVLSEEEPPTPSTRLRTLAGEERARIAARRGLRLEKLGRDIPADLDWIVMKCLEKDRCRRYDTVNGLALDLIRHLTNEPVLARPPGKLYRFQKAFQRNRAAFVSGFAVALALVLGTIASTWQMVRARRAETQARAEAGRATTAERLAKERGEQIAAERDAKDSALRKSEAISRFLNGVFESPDPRRDGRQITVVEILDRAAAKLETDLAKQPAERRRLQAVLAQTYHALGVFNEALRLREKIHAESLAAFGPDSRELIVPAGDLANSYGQAGRHDEAVKLRERALELETRHGGTDTRNAIIARNHLATSYAAVGKREEALQLLDQALATSRRVLGAEALETFSVLANIAIFKHDEGQLAEALALRETVMDGARRVMGRDHPFTLDSMLNLTASYISLNRFEAAARLGEEAVEISTRINGLAHPRTLTLLQSLVVAYRSLGRAEDERRILASVLEVSRKLNGEDHVSTLRALQGLASLPPPAGSTNASPAPASELQLKQRRIFLSSPKDTFVALGYAARLAWEGKTEEYEEARRLILERAARFTDPGELDRSAKAASLLPGADRESLAAALAYARRSVEAGARHPYLAFFQLGQGIAEYRSGHFADAEAVLARVAPNPGAGGVLNSTASFFRALALFRLDRKDEAQSVFTAAARTVKPLPPVREALVAQVADADTLILWLTYLEAKSALQL